MTKQQLVFPTGIFEYETNWNFFFFLKKKNKANCKISEYPFSSRNLSVDIRRTIELKLTI